MLSMMVKVTQLTDLGLWAGGAVTQVCAALCVSIWLT